MEYFSNCFCKQKVAISGCEFLKNAKEIELHVFAVFKELNDGSFWVLFLKVYHSHLGNNEFCQQRMIYFSPLKSVIAGFNCMNISELPHISYECFSFEYVKPVETAFEQKGNMKNFIKVT